MEYDFYEVVKAVVKKVSMVNPGRSNLSKNKVYSSQQEAGFEDIICGWIDVMELVKDIKSIRKIQIIGLKALGYYNWEISEILKIPERTLDRKIAEIKRFFIKSGGKSAGKTTLKGERSINA